MRFIDKIKSLLDSMDKNKGSRDKIIEAYTSEFLKCQKNPLYFIEHYIKLEIPGLDVFFKLHKGQKRLLTALIKYNYLIVLKSRQIGISTIVQAYCAWLCVFYKNVGIGIISKDQSEATNFTKVIVSMLEKLPSWFNVTFKKKDQQSFILKNGCKCYSATVSPAEPTKCLRGRPLTFLVIDEAAHVGKIRTAYAGIGPTLGTAQVQAKQNNVPYGTVILSTPNRSDKSSNGFWYYETWVNAVQGTVMYKPLKIWWKNIPFFTKNKNEWYENQKRILMNDVDNIAQELDLAFLSGSKSKLEQLGTDVINNIRSGLKNKIRTVEFEIEGYKMELDIWKNPKECLNKIIIGVDSATSSGADNSCICGQDIKTGEQVFEFLGKIPSPLIPKLTMKIMDLYPNCICVPENDGIGHATSEAIELEDKYNDRLYMSTILSSDGKTVKGHKAGISQRSKRPEIIEAFFETLKENPNYINSEKLFLEICGLRRTPSGKIEGYPHDDAFMAWAICCYIRRYNLGFNNTDVNLISNDTSLNDSELNIACNFVNRDLNYMKSKLRKSFESNALLNHNSGINSFSNSPIDWNSIKNTFNNDELFYEIFNNEEVHNPFREMLDSTYDKANEIEFKPTNLDGNMIKVIDDLKKNSNRDV